MKKKYRIEELIDMDLFQSLQDRLNEIYSFPSSIIDNEGNILTATGWQDVCVNFHRKHPECERDCLKSDKYIVDHIDEADPAITYICPRGLVDNAAPIIIDGEHLANFFTGQFFLEPPDLDYYREEARRFGFDEEAYIEAVKKVPIWTKNQLDNYLYFIKGMIEVIAGIGLKNLREIETKEHIQASEAKYRQLVEQMQEGILQVDNDDKIVFVNDKFCEQMGYSRNELMGVIANELLVHAEDRAAIVEKNRQRTLGASEKYELRLIRKSGETGYFHLSASPVKNSDGEVIGSMALCMDVTKRKEAERKLRDSEERFNLFMKHLPGAVSIKDAEGRLAFANESFAAAAGCKPEEIIGKKDAEFSDPEALKIFEAENKRVFEVGETIESEASYPTPGGETHWLTQKFPIYKDGKISYIGMISSDITARKNAERDLMKYKKIISTSPDGFSLVDKNYIYRIVNDAYEKLSGKNRDEILGKTVAEYLGEESFENDVKPHFDACLSGEIVEYQEWFEYAAAGRKFVYVTYFPFIDENGEVAGVIANSKDITALKLADDALKESEAKFRNYIDYSPYGVFVADESGRYVEVNKAASDITGYSREELLSMAIKDVVPKDDIPERMKTFEKVKTEGGSYVESRFVHKSGETRWWSVAAVKIAENRFLAYATDINDRIAAQNALRESEEKYRLLHEKSGFGVGYYAPDGTIISFNRVAAAHMAGKPEDFAGKTLFDIFPKEAAEEYMRRLKLALEESQEVEFEDEVDLPSGKKWFYSKYAVIRDIDASVIGVQIISQDITDRKNVEEELKLREADLKKAQSIASLGSWRFDLTSGKIEWSEELFNIFERDPAKEPPSYEEHKQIIHNDDWDSFDNLSRKSAQTGEGFNLTFRIRTNSETIKWIKTIAETKKSYDGAVVELFGTAQDVSEQKRAEDRIAMLYERLNIAAQAAKMGVWDWDIQNNELVWDDKMYELYGISKGDFPNVYEGWVAALHPDNRDASDALARRVAAGGGDYDAEFRIIRGNGEVRILKAYAKTIRNEAGVALRMTGVNYDVTERRAAEEALRESEEKFKAAFYTSPDSININKIDGEYVEINEGFTTIMGFTRADVVGKKSSEINIWAIAEDRQKLLTGLQTRGKVENLESTFRAKDGSLRRGLMSARIVNISGEPCILSITRDITAYREAEEARNELRRRYETIAKSFPNGVIFLYDKEIRYILAEGRGLDAIGLKPEDIVGKTLFEAFPKSVSDIVAPAVEKIFAKKEVYYEVEFLDRLYANWGAPIISGGEVSEGVVFAVDITEMKKKEIALRESEERFKKLSALTFEGITIHKMGICVDANESFCKLLGYSREEIIGKNLIETIVRKDYRPLVIEKIQKSYVSPYEVVGVRRGGEELPCEIMSQNIVWEGEPMRVSAVRDITERKKYERRLIAAKEKAEESDRLKTSFLQNMSHEIRTPLNGIVGFANLLTNFEDLSAEEIKEFVELIQSSSFRLLGIVNDVLEISRLDVGAVKVNKSKFKISEAARYFHSLFYQKITYKELDFILNIDEDCETMSLFTDKDKFYQIITNLLNNAYKFTEAGEIELGARPDAGGVEFYVRDTGIGIKREYFEKVFDRFWQYEAYDKKKYGGTGLGLSIIKGLSDILGFEITLESEFGAGAAFYVKIPGESISREETPDVPKSKPAKDAPELSGLKILVAEDESSNFYYFKSALRKENVEIAWAKDGVEAVEFVSKEKFDVILLDLKMPRMDGFEAARKIKIITPNTPIIAQTAYSMYEEKLKATEAGCDAFISKPIEKKILFSTIRDALRRL